MIHEGNYGKLLEPGLRKIFMETYKELPEQFSQVFNVNTSKKAMETDLRMGGFSMWDEKGTTDSTKYEDPTLTDTVVYKHTTFSKGFIVEKELVDDEMYGQIKKMPKALARAARSTIETKAASVFNNAAIASPRNWKGEALVGTHALLGGGTTTNAIGNLVLSEANLETALKLASEQVDERGLKIQMNPNILVVSRKNQFVAEKIAKTESVPVVNIGADSGGTVPTFASLDYNPMKGRFKVVVLDYLDPANEDNWFLLDSSLHELNFFWRERLNFKSTTDFDTDQAKYKGRFRISYGWSDHRGVLGAIVS
jgi:hypothetical protein